MLNEKIVVKRAKAGDERAFEQLVTAYEKKVYSIAYRNTRNEQDALDISQEVFVRVYKALPQFKEESAFSTWLFRIISNSCIDFARKKQGKETVSLFVQGNDSEDVLMEIPDMAYNPEETYEKKELREEISEALLGLSENHRQIVLMRDISGFSYAEIGAVLSLEEGTVKSRLARARENLRRILISRGTIGLKSSLNTEKGGAMHDIL